MKYLLICATTSIVETFLWLIPSLPLPIPALPLPSLISDQCQQPGIHLNPSLLCSHYLEQTYSYISHYLLLHNELSKAKWHETEIL